MYIILTILFKYIKILIFNITTHEVLISVAYLGRNFALRRPDVIWYRQQCCVKNANYSVKRGLLEGQKRPTTGSKEAYYRVKRGLLEWEKRPTRISKETYSSVERDLLECFLRNKTSGSVC